MGRGRRRWYVIAACLAIPAGLLLVGGDGSRRVTLDPTFPARCDVVLRQVEAGEVAAARTAATALVTGEGSTLEEQGCAGGIAARLASAAAPPLAITTAGTCDLARALSLQGAGAAAAAVLELLPPGERAASCELPAGDAGPGPEPRPRCAAVARQLLGGPLGDAETSLAAALDDPDTSAVDSACLVRVRRALATLRPAAPATPTRLDATPPVALGCAQAAVHARAGRLGAAREAYEQVLDAVDDQRGRACAVGGLARLPAEQTLADRTFARANHLTREVTSWGPGAPVVLADGARAAVVGAVWFLTVGLLLVALRQLLRWRRERTPGPVEIRLAGAPPGGDGGVAVVEVIRETLVRAGVYPSPAGAGLGEVVIDVTEVLGVAGETGWLGRLVGAVRAALAVKTGATLTVKLDEDPAAPPASRHRVIAELSAATSGATIGIATYAAASARAAAVDAAHGTYLELVRDPVVACRTAPPLRWTSGEGLRLYQQAQLDSERGSSLTALAALRRAAPLEPGNVLVQLALLRTHMALAAPGPRDVALRRDNRREVADHYLAALVAGARAVVLAPRSDETHAHLGLVLGQVERWADAWDSDRGPGAEFLRLHPEGRAQERAAVVADATPDAVRAWARELAGWHWRRALRQTKLWWLLWDRSLVAEQRSTVRGLLWPWRRRRKALQDLYRAGHIGALYDRGASRALGARVRAWQWCRLAFVRRGRWWSLRRHPAVEATVAYNLATAYARRAVWLGRPRTMVEAQLAWAEIDAGDAFSAANRAVRRARVLASGVPGAGWPQAVDTAVAQVLSAAADAYLASCRAVRRPTSAGAVAAAEAATRRAMTVAGGAVDVPLQATAPPAVAHQLAPELEVVATHAARAAGRTRRAHAALRAVDDDVRMASAAAVAALERSARGSGSPWSRDDMAYTDDDADLVELRAAPGGSSTYAAWRVRFGPPPDEAAVTRAAWHDVFGTIAARSEAAALWWVVHQADPVPSSWRWAGPIEAWTREAVGWLGDDVERWSLLATWLGDAAATRPREAFEAGIPDAPLNGGRPVRRATPTAGPVPPGRSPAEIRRSSTEAVDRCRAFAVASRDAAAEALERVVVGLEARDGRLVVEEVQRAGPDLAGRWRRVATWARDPSTTP